MQTPSPDLSHPDFLNRNLPDWNLRICTLKKNPLPKSQEFESSDPDQGECRAGGSCSFCQIRTQYHQVECTNGHQRERGRVDSSAALCSYCADHNLTPCTFVSSPPLELSLSLCTPGARAAQGPQSCAFVLPHRLLHDAGGPGHHDPVHHSLLHCLSDLLAPALPPQAGREICFNLHHPAHVM